MKQVLFVFCLFVGFVVCQTSLTPISHPSQSATVSPRADRTDYIDYTYSQESYEYNELFSTFGSSFFEYFGFSSVDGIDDEDPTSQQDDDEFLFGDDDDGGDDDGADDDDENVEFNDVGKSNNLLPSLFILFLSFAMGFVLIIVY